MLHAEYMRSTNLSIINFTPVFTIWSWLLWHIQRPPKCYIRSKPISAYTKYLFWRVLNVLLTKELLKILLDSVSEKGMWKKSFQDNPEIWQLLRWIWWLLNVFIRVHCICRSSMPQEPRYNFRLHLRVGEQILLSHVFPQLHALHHFFIFR